MKTASKQFLINLAICVISMIAIVIFKLLYYDSINKNVIVNGDVAFLMASTVGATMAWRLSEQSNGYKIKGSQSLTVFSGFMCALGVIAYGVGILFCREEQANSLILSNNLIYDLKTNESLMICTNSSVLFWCTCVIMCLCFINIIIESLVAVHTIKLSQPTDNFDYMDKSF